MIVLPALASAWVYTWVRWAALDEASQEGVLTVNLLETSSGNEEIVFAYGDDPAEAVVTITPSLPTP